MFPTTAVEILVIHSCLSQYNDWVARLNARQQEQLGIASTCQDYSPW